jgi:hypothetical protein
MKLDWTSWAGKAAGVNWYKWGAILVLAVAYSGGLVAYGYDKASDRCEQEKTKVAEEKTRTIVKEITVRVPVVQIREVESAKQRQEIARLKEKLDEAIAKKPENPACALTSDERDGFNDLFKKTRPTK